MSSLNLIVFQDMCQLLLMDFSTKPSIILFTYNIFRPPVKFRVIRVICTRVIRVAAIWASTSQGAINLAIYNSE